MNADPADQLRLLELQALDSRLDRLAHRRGSLPEIAAIEALDAALATLADEETLAETETRDLGRAQSKLDGDVELVRTRRARDQTRLDSGSVTSSKELLDLQAEIASLERRQATLEDEELEIMQSREDADAVLAGVQSRIGAARTDRDATVSARSEAESAIDAELASARGEREALAPGLPGDLLRLYDTVRAQQGGVGAAALYRGRCGGCHLELGAAEIREVKAAAPDAVLRHDECRRILVRTPESGLGSAPAS